MTQVRPTVYAPSYLYGKKSMAHVRPTVFAPSYYSRTKDSQQNSRKQMIPARETPSTIYEAYDTYRHAHRLSHKRVDHKRGAARHPKKTATRRVRPATQRSRPRHGLKRNSLAPVDIAIGTPVIVDVEIVIAAPVIQRQARHNRSRH